MWLLSILFILFFLFDVQYFVRVILLALVSYTRRLFKKRSIFEEFSHLGMCLTRDLDHMVHMNNARYLREADFARMKFWIETYAWDAIKKLGVVVTLGASTIRYRRSINLFEIYSIKTKLMSWDDKAFYLEQRWVRNRDGFIMAVALLKQNMIGASPGQIVEKLLGRPIDSPEPPDEIKHFALCHQASSEKLKKEL